MSDAKLSDVLPVFKTVIVGGTEVEIRHVKVGKVSAITEIIGPLIPLFTQAGGLKGGFSAPNIASLVMTHTKDVVRLVSIVTDKPEKWVNELDIDELITLVTDIVEVNLDFFIQRVLPSVLQATERLGGVFVERTQNLTTGTLFKD